MIPPSALAAPVWRVVATRNPPISLFEDVAPADAQEALVDLEIAYSPHYNQLKLLETGLARTEWVFGPGAGYIMAPFVYRAPGRFSDGGYGVFYAGLEAETAIAEVAFHRGLFLETTGEGPMFLEESLVTAKADGAFTDVRGSQATLPDLYSPDFRDYPKAQAWGAVQRAAGRDGIAYSSVRHPGSCLAVFRPKVIQNCRLTKLFRFWWDGRRVQEVP